MAGYTPLKITGYETGLVQEREEFLLPNDAYPQLENAFVWRERIKRKQGFKLLGRLRRNLATFPVGPAIFIGQTDASGNFTINLFTKLVALGYISASENPSIVLGNIQVHIDTDGTFIDTPLSNGTLSNGSGGTGTINYATGALTLTTNNGAFGTQNVNVYVFSYYPNLPVMGLRSEELDAINVERTIAFDTKYAYQFVTGWKEFIPGTTWNGNDSDFFWSTNWWTLGTPPKKLFWVTNFNFGGVVKDPIRYTDGTTWYDFGPTAAPTTGQIDSVNFLTQALALLPFRGRLLAFNTLEGPTLAGSTQYPNRIRWSQIGNPLQTYVVAPSTLGSWRDDVRGRGGFLDIPTSEDIVAVGFVRDNLVIYCERSTWQLRYTGRSIAPFQIEKVNSELGAESTFSAVQFDTSLIGIGDKGVVECDSFKSDRIDIKIPDLVFEFNNDNDGPKRVHGIRDFVQRIAYWIFPFSENNGTYPDRRLVYNYENDSWAIFTDSLTCLGTFQPVSTLKWNNQPEVTWQKANYFWGNQPARIPTIIGGNQQGYVEYIGGGIAEGQTTNDESLYIQDIIGHGILTSSLPIDIVSPAHNLQTGDIIKIIGIPATTPFATELNNNIFQVNLDGTLPANKFYLTKYDIVSQQFNDPALAASGTYIGGGQIQVRDNFSILSKKFNYMDQGMQFQLGYIDILMDDTDNGAISLNVYNDYNGSSPSNTYPENANVDTFFNSVCPTNNPGISVKGGSKNWHRVFCPTNSNFVTLEWTLSNEQMQNQCQESDVQIDAQIIWNRVGGRMGITQ